MVAVLNSLIELDQHGVPWITGANTKVVEEDGTAELEDPAVA